MKEFLYISLQLSNICCHPEPGSPLWDRHRIHHVTMLPTWVPNRPVVQHQLMDTHQALSAVDTAGHPPSFKFTHLTFQIEKS